MATIVHPFHPQADDGLVIEAQRLDATHPVRSMGLHGHTFFEVILFCDGDGTHRVNGASHRAVAGRLFVLAPGDVHECGALGSATGWILLFGHEAIAVRALDASNTPRWPYPHPLLDPFAARQATQRPVVALTDAQFGRWRSGLERIAAELAERKAHYRSVVRSTLQLLLIDLARLDGAQVVDATTPELTAPVARALRYIDGHFLRDVTARDVADHVGRSAAHLTTAMRVKSGLTIRGWITRRRMDEARRLLLETDLSVDEIAPRVCYSDAAAFARAFRRAYRMTPGAWRTEHRPSADAIAIGCTEEPVVAKASSHS